MTTRYNALIVALEEDMREDDAQGLIDAIARLRGVIAVKGQAPGENLDYYVAEERTQQEWRKKFIDLLWPKRTDEHWSR